LIILSNHNADLRQGKSGPDSLWSGSRLRIRSRRTSKINVGFLV